LTGPFQKGEAARASRVPSRSAERDEAHSEAFCIVLIRPAGLIITDSGFTTSKNVGSGGSQNRVKRLVRGIFRLNSANFSESPNPASTSFSIAKRQFAEPWTRRG